MATEIEKRERCTGCAHKFDENEAAFCDSCANDDDEDFDGAPFESSAASDVMAWAERRRLLSGMTPEAFALFELCSEDLR